MCGIPTKGIFFAIPADPPRFAPSFSANGSAGGWYGEDRRRHAFPFSFIPGRSLPALRGLPKGRFRLLPASVGISKVINTRKIPSGKFRGRSSSGESSPAPVSSSPGLSSGSGRNRTRPHPPSPPRGFRRVRPEIFFCIRTLRLWGAAQTFACSAAAPVNGAFSSLLIFRGLPGRIHFAAFSSGCRGFLCPGQSFAADQRNLLIKAAA